MLPDFPHRRNARQHLLPTGVQHRMWPEILKAGTSLVGGLLGFGGQQNTNATNREIAQQTNAFNAEQAQKQMDFQERMSDTQYQRATADMRAAGLNPMLAYQQGGAGTPSGSSASGVAARVDNPNTSLAQGLQDSVSGALEAAKTMADIANTNADTTNKGVQKDTIQAQGEQAGAQARLTRYQGNLLNENFSTLMKQAVADLGLTQAQAKEVGTRGTLEGFDIPAALNASNANKTLFGKYVIPYLDSAQKITDIVGDFIKPGIALKGLNQGRDTQTHTEYYKGGSSTYTSTRPTP